MSTLSAAVLIPDSLLAKEATGILREHSTDLLFNHSMRVYLFAAELGIIKSITVGSGVIDRRMTM
jgi:hypothetical protein